jgi:hypothetical protein
MQTNSAAGNDREDFLPTKKWRFLEKLWPGRLWCIHHTTATTGRLFISKN